MGRFIDLDPAQLPLADVAEAFRQFYEVPPWNERWRCPVCSPPGDFGPAGRYADPALQYCPVCGTGLEQYWRDERVREYLEQAQAKAGFRGLVCMEGHQVAGWAWGYNASEVPELIGHGDLGFYIDVIGVIPEFRRNSMDLFRAGHTGLTDLGYPYIVTRTHTAAKHVQRVMKLHGYKLLKQSVDPEREFWIRFP